MQTLQDGQVQEGDDAMISESRLVRSNHGAACLLELCLHRIDRSRVYMIRGGLGLGADGPPEPSNTLGADGTVFFYSLYTHWR